MVFEDLVGKVFGFYGVDGNEFKLGRKIWLAIEDPDDGYRSYLGSIEVSKENTEGIFFRKPLAKVKVVSVDDRSFNGFELIDEKDQHCWLMVGTDCLDDYYPYFVFNYQPKKR